MPAVDQSGSQTEPQGRLTCAQRVRDWIIYHDQRLSFAIAYVSLAVGLSIFISLFWLLVLVAGHFLLELTKKHLRGYRGVGHMLGWTLWDVKYDLVLGMMAFVLVGYYGASFGFLGAQSVASGRALGSGLARMSRLIHAVRGVVVDALIAVRVAIVRKADMARAARRAVTLGALASKPAGEREQLGPVPNQPFWRVRWTRGDWIVLALLGVNLAALLAAPLITDQTWLGLIENFQRELHPWPG